MDEKAPAEGHLALADGQQHDVEEWEKAAAAVLRKARRLGADDPDSAVWDALTRATLDGIGVPPLGTADLVAGLPDAGVPGAPPYTRGRTLSRPEDGWDVRAAFADPDPKATAEAAVTDLENGATSLWLQVGPTGLPHEDLATALDGVLLDLAPVVLETTATPFPRPRPSPRCSRNAGSPRQRAPTSGQTRSVPRSARPHSRRRGAGG